jgi:hypothetical protein
MHVLFVLFACIIKIVKQVAIQNVLLPKPCMFLIPKSKQELFKNPVVLYSVV